MEERRKTVASILQLKLEENNKKTPRNAWTRTEKENKLQHRHVLVNHGFVEIHIADRIGGGKKLMLGIAALAPQRHPVTHRSIYLRPSPKHLATIATVVVRSQALHQMRVALLQLGQGFPQLLRLCLFDLEHGSPLVFDCFAGAQVGFLLVRAQQVKGALAHLGEHQSHFGLSEERVEILDAVVDQYGAQRRVVAGGARVHCLSYQGNVQVVDGGTVQLIAEHLGRYFFQVADVELVAARVELNVGENVVSRGWTAMPAILLVVLGVNRRATASLCCGCAF